MVLGDGEAAVSEIVDRLHLPQPQVSKHLGVLRAVDLVRCRTVGRRRLYRVNGAGLKPVHDWVRAFERHWNERFDRLDDLLTELPTGGSPVTIAPTRWHGTHTVEHTSKEHRDGHVGSGMEQGMQHSLDRIEDLLASDACR